MYATSKLIIPHKPAGNIPYIPKLRIKIRPSTVRGRSLHFKRFVSDGQSLKGSYKLSSNTHHQGIECYMNGANEDRVDGFAADIESITNNNEHSYDQCSFSGNKRNHSKRKRSISTEDFDLDNPESLLAKINLKAIINRDTFYALPIDTQRTLASLLPVYDRDKQLWDTFLSSLAQLDPPIDAEKPSAAATVELPPDEQSLESSVWLHESALSNEFFAKAIQDYTDRQRQGLFAQRARNRAGLRTTVAGRFRYSNLAQSEDDSENTSSNSVNCNGNNKLYHTRRSNHHRLPIHHHYHPKGDQFCPRRRGATGVAAAAAASVTTASSTSSNEATFGRRKTKLPKKYKLIDWHGRRQSKRHRIGALQPVTSTIQLSTPTTTTTNTAHSRRERLVLRSSALKHDVPLVDLSSVGFQSPNRNENKPSSSLSPKSNTFSDDPVVVTPVPNTFSPSFPGVRSDMANSPVTARQTPPVDYGKSLVSPVGSPSHPTRGNSSANISTVIDSSATSPAGMPPPRQTKTLATMREKLRAKRLMKEAERHVPGKMLYGLPGSMTPHPASGSSGYFHQPTNYYAPSVVSNFDTPTMSEDVKSPVKSALSSPAQPVASPFPPCDKPSADSSFSADEQSAIIKIVSSSPSPCHSVSQVDLLSPVSNQSTPVQLFADSNERTTPRLFSTDRNTASYPSSPSSKSPRFPAEELHLSSFHNQSQLLPSSIGRLVDSSSSAPSTPSVPQLGQSSIGCLPTSLGSSFTPPNDNKQNPLIYITPAQNSSKLTPSVSPKVTISDPNPATFPSTSTVQFIASQLRPSYSSPQLPTNSIAELAEPSTMTQQSSSLSSSPKKSCDQTAVNSSSVVSPSAVSQLLNATNSRPNSTTRAFLVDGDNLSQALAWVQSSNPEATITQLQFFLIPGANRSQMFLYRAPTTESSTVSTSASVSTVSVAKTMTSNNNQVVKSNPVADLASSQFKPPQSVQICSPVAVPKSDSVAFPINIQPGLVIPDPKTVSVASVSSVSIPTKSLNDVQSMTTMQSNHIRSSFPSHPNPCVVDLTQDSGISMDCCLDRSTVPVDSTPPPTPINNSQLTISLLSSPPPSTGFRSEPAPVVMIANPTCQSVTFTQHPINTSPYYATNHFTTTATNNQQQFSLPSTHHHHLQPSPAQFTVINPTIYPPAQTQSPTTFNSHLTPGFSPVTSFPPFSNGANGGAVGGHLQINSLPSTQYHPPPSVMDGIYMQTTNLIPSGPTAAVLLPPATGQHVPSAQWVVHPHHNLHSTTNFTRPA